MPRTYPPISITAAVSRVKAKAREWFDDSTDEIAKWGRTFVEPDKKVYITADQERALITKWQNDSTPFEGYHKAGSGSSNGAQVDLKLQLDEDRPPTWKKNTSPFVYHIPIDIYRSPEDIAAEAAAKRQKEEVAQQRADEALAKAQAAKEKAAELKKQKDKAKLEQQMKQAMQTAWNAALSASKVKPGDKAKWEKEWVTKNGARYQLK